MASLYKQRYTTKIPPKAEIVKIDGKKKVRMVGRGGKTKLLDFVRGRDGDDRMVGYSPNWMINYVDYDGRRRVKSTGCRDKTAARQVMTQLELEVEQVRSGVLSRRELRLAEYRVASIEELIRDYLTHLAVKTVKGRRICEAYRRGAEQRLRQILEECQFRTLDDVNRESVENWMLQAENKGTGPRTINCYRSAILAFCNWAVKYQRLASNPLAGLFRADESRDTRHQRRAITEEEVARLLRAAELRPIAEYGRPKIPKDPSKPRGRHNWTRGPLTWENLEECYQLGLEAMKNSPGKIKEYRRIGRQRKLAYRVLLTTGLRKGELAAVTVDCLHLNAERPFLLLPGSFTKNGQTATIPLRAEITEAVRAWIDELGLFSLDPVFDPIPTIRNFDADIAAANIPKRDERNRVVDIHALRHTFGTHLAKAGVAPRTAMAAMRHSKIELTMNVYTDPALLDIAGAVDSLPAF
ncbi:MAG: site-specific integrase [Phycisphaerae bacterium]|nr:site-specific integrase [Phycisphaerae bacterium]